MCIKTAFLTGTTVGDKVMLPTVSFAANATQMSFVVKTKHFSTKAAFAVTVNKMQRLTFILKDLSFSRTIQAVLSHAINSNRISYSPRINLKYI
jgi:hypothetical protein